MAVIYFSTINPFRMWTRLSNLRFHVSSSNCWCCCRSCPQAAENKPVLCVECRTLIQHFCFDSFLPGALYVAQAARCEDEGLSPPHVKLQELAMAAYKNFSSMIVILSFVRLSNSHPALLKLMFLKTELLEFHPLAEVCGCKGLFHLEDPFLKSFYHTLLKNAVRGFNLDTRVLKCGEDKPPRMGAQASKLAKLSQKNCR